jgi:hypothetical protein
MAQAIDREKMTRPAEAGFAQQCRPDQGVGGGGAAPPLPAVRTPARFAA